MLTYVIFRNVKMLHKLQSHLSLVTFSENYKSIVHLFIESVQKNQTCTKNT